MGPSPEQTSFCVYTVQLYHLTPWTAVLCGNAQKLKIACTGSRCGRLAHQLFTKSTTRWAHHLPVYCFQKGNFCSTNLKMCHRGWFLSLLLCTRRQWLWFLHQISNRGRLLIMITLDHTSLLTIDTFVIGTYVISILWLFFLAQKA